MPELPDIEAYLAALRPRLVGQTIQRVRIRSPFLVRTFDPPVERVAGRKVAGLQRLGKRIVFELEGDLFLVLHLMIAGRLRWSDKPGGAVSGIAQAGFDLANGTLLLTEAGTKKRASLHVVAGEAGLRQHDPGGLDPLSVALYGFTAAIRGGNRTLKRALTDPHTFSGIGNAYSDEILHAAQLSPIMLTGKLDDHQVARLHDATRTTLRTWTDRLLMEFADRFPGPGDITAFRPDFAVHGKFGQPCPICGAAVQRIRYADNETNYCPRCQTGGRILADRSLSRLLKDDWPRSIDELE